MQQILIKETIEDKEYSKSRLFCLKTFSNFTKSYHFLRIIIFISYILLHQILLDIITINVTLQYYYFRYY